MSSSLQRLPNQPATNFTLPQSFSCSFSFLPTQIPGCKLWLDGGDPAGTGVAPANGSTVSTWNDKSGRANNMSLISGTVTYNANIKAVNFQSGGVLQTPSSTTVTASQSVVFVVCQATAITGGSGYVFSCLSLYGRPGDYSIRFVSLTTINDVNGNDLGFGTAYYVNGALAVPSGGVITVPSSQPNIIYGIFSVSGTTQLMLSTTFESRYFVGNIQEVLLYTGPITTGQQQQVEGYLAWKWGLQANLPASHPYKTITPSPLFSTQAFISTTMGQRVPGLVRYVTFNPLSFSGLQLWLDAADSSTVGMSGTSVISWSDKSGNGYTAVKSSLSVGSITTSTQNNLSVIATNSQVMTIPSFPWTSFATMFFVINTNNWFYVAGTTSYVAYVYSQNNGLYVPGGGGGFNDSVLAVNTQVIPINQWCIFSIGYGGGTQATNYCINGTPRSTTTGTARGNSTTVTSLWLNGRWDYATGYNPIIGEILHYNTSLSTAQRQQLEGYLAWKWGIQANLPAKHPYNLFPPPP
jgi:hypothetical protein